MLISGHVIIEFDKWFCSFKFVCVTKNILLWKLTCWVSKASSWSLMMLVSVKAFNISILPCKTLQIKSKKTCHSEMVNYFRTVLAKIWALNNSSNSIAKWNKVWNIIFSKLRHENITGRVPGVLRSGNIEEGKDYVEHLTNSIFHLLIVLFHLLLHLGSLFSHLINQL